MPFEDDASVGSSDDESFTGEVRDAGHTFMTLASEGDVLAKHGDFKRAVDSYTRALDIREDKNVYVARSKCYMQLGESKKALADVDEALTQDKDYYKALYQKAEALFASGDFEYALIYYHRGHKLRPDLVDFRLGIQKAQQAINESIDVHNTALPAAASSQAGGTATAASANAAAPGAAENSSGTPLAVQKAQAQAAAAIANASGVPKLDLSSSTKVPQDSARDARELLGELSADQMYLQQLKSDRSLSQSDVKINELINDGLKYLHTRREFWRQQKPPMSSRSAGGKATERSRAVSDPTHRRKKPTTRPRTNTMTSGRSGRSNAPGQPVTRQKYVQQTKFAIESLEEVNTALEGGDPELGLKFAKSFLHRLATLDIADKSKILGNLYSMMGNTYLDLAKLNLAAVHHRKDLDIAIEHNYRDSYVRALGNLGRVYQKLEDHPQAIAMWEKKLELSEKQEETWLCANIGHSFYCLGEYRDAIRYEERALEALKAFPDPRVQMKSNFIIGNSYFKLNKPKDAIAALQRHVELARELQEPEAEAKGLHHLANVYLHAGEPANSKECKEKAIELRQASDAAAADAPPDAASAAAPGTAAVASSA